MPIIPIPTWLLAAITLLTLLGTVPASPAGEAELGRVRAEWPPAARRLDEMFDQARGTAQSWYDNPRASGKSLFTDARFAIDHDMEKVEISRSTQGSRPTKLGDIVHCVGEGTAFRLNRRAGVELYNVEGIGTTRSDRDLYVSVFGRFVHAHHGVMGRPMNRVLDSPGFEIASAEAIELDGKNLMKVDCAFGPHAPKEQVSLVLDPDAGWSVRSCRYRPGYDLNRLYTFEVDYGPSRDAIPLPRRIKLVDPGRVVHHCVFKDWTFAPTPISEFNMTHYGLPDLVHANRPRNPLPYWLAGLAVLAGSFAFVLWRLASRGSRPAGA